MMGLPITVLENILHNGIVKPANPVNPTMPSTSTDSIELKTGEIVTVEDLCDFWIEGHKKILETTKIINDAKELMQSERKSKEEKELQAEQKVEGIQTQEECGTKGNRSHNKKETVQGCESSPQKPKRRRVRKSE